MLWIELLQIVIFLHGSCNAQISLDAFNQNSAVREYYLDFENQIFKNNPKINNGPHYSRRYISYSDESGNCECSCKNCDKPKRCCKKVCTRCHNRPPRPAQPPRYPQVQQNTGSWTSLVMIPYPVPFFAYPMQNTTESNQTTTKKTTTTTKSPLKSFEPKMAATTTTEAPFPESATGSTMNYFDKRNNAKLVGHPKCPRLAQCFNDSLELEANNHYRSKLSAKRRREVEIMHSIRPTIGIKDTRSKYTPARRMPKYGLVRIPDFVSEKRMKQLFVKK